jgi:hypothetical protein
MVLSPRSQELRVSIHLQICRFWAISNLFNIETEEKVQIEKNLKFGINIIRVPETDKHCIEGFVLEGDKLEFNKIFWEMKGHFGGHANTNHVE